MGAFASILGGASSAGDLASLASQSSQSVATEEAANAITKAADQKITMDKAAAQIDQEAMQAIVG